LAAVAAAGKLNPAARWAIASTSKALPACSVTLRRCCGIGDSAFHCAAAWYVSATNGRSSSGVYPQMFSIQGTTNHRGKYNAGFDASRPTTPKSSCAK